MNVIKSFAVDLTCACEGLSSFGGNLGSHPIMVTTSTWVSIWPVTPNGQAACSLLEEMQCLEVEVNVAWRGVVLWLEVMLKDVLFFFGGENHTYIGACNVI